MGLLIKEEHMKTDSEIKRDVEAELRWGRISTSETSR
jgi:hypothetical protein